MSKLGELLKKYCPNGVDYKPLGSLCSIVTKQTGFDYTNHIKNRLLRNKEEDSVPYMQTKFFSGHVFNYETDYYVPMDVLKRFPKITLDQKCLLFSIVGASIGNVGLFPADRVCFLGGAICVAKVLPDYNVDYLYYCVESSRFQNQIRKKTKGPQATITVDDIRNFSIPVPPLPVQDEIVRILDNYIRMKDELDSKLRSEIMLRKKQYDYYRSKTLCFNSDFKTLPIQAVIKKHCSGATPKKGKKEYYENATIPWIRTQDVKFNEIENVDSYITEIAVKETGAKWIPVNCVIVAISGASAGRCAINKIRATTNQHCLNLEIDESKALYRYVFHCLKNQYHDLISKKQGARGDLNASLILSLEIPVPNIEKQYEVISILDTYDRLFSELSSDLSSEINARQRQYDYYRDKLLAFNPLNHNTFEVNYAVFQHRSPDE